MIPFVVVDLFLYILLASREGVKINTLLILSSWTGNFWILTSNSKGEDPVGPLRTMWWLLFQQLGWEELVVAQGSRVEGTVLTVSWEGYSKAAITWVVRIWSSVVMCEGCLFSLPHSHRAHSPGTPSLAPKAGQGPVVSWLMFNLWLSKGWEFLIFSIFWFLRCKYSHDGQFQDLFMNSELERNAQDWFLKVCANNPQHTTD